MAKISCKNSGDVIPGFQSLYPKRYYQPYKWYNPRLHGRGIGSYVQGLKCKL
ncbi:MAG: hypothetical protein AB8U78_00225 [Rickettsia slovaca]|uniref:hypothetical protein n=1 Tax=Rickettsia slovaca TaxID=35794 RepID=UPI00031C58CF|nr:hypothetical protein [Rickettsia slovaca]